MKKNYGLTKEQVKVSQAEYGSNKLAEIEVETFWDKLKGNLEDPIIKILIFALGINVALAILGLGSWLDTVGIAIAVTLATGIATWTEHSNEESFQKLQAEASQVMCKVYRDGALKEVCIDDIVKGDIVSLQPGDLIPADGRLIEGLLSVDQASLNGESKEAKKKVTEQTIKVDYTDTFNQQALFRGTVVTDGEALLEVERVGEKTLYGETMAEMDVEEVMTPLKEKLQSLADLIAKLGTTMGILAFVTVMFNNIFIANNFDGELITAYLTYFPTLATDIVNAFIIGVVLVVVAVPEGIPLLISLVLSLNMKKMLVAKVLVRKLPGIETAGNLNILFTDKTGTLSQGLISVVSFIDGTNRDYHSYKDLPEGLKAKVNTSIINNNGASFSDKKGKAEILGGNATDRALLSYVETTKKDTMLAVLSKIPFSSARKFSAVEVEVDGRPLTLLKGAPEKLLSNCTLTYDGEGKEVELTGRMLETLEARVSELASRAIRVLALVTTNELADEEEIPSNCTLVGIVALRDDVRPEVPDAVKEVQGAGVQVVMATGDNVLTARAIAEETGIIKSKDEVVLTSAELNNMDDGEVKELLPRLRVLARALPADKSRLVRLSQELGLVCAMTGDGSNDGPALKRADVGFAMGSGSETAKAASDIVLMDDNFASIKSAILYGRTIYKSIQKFITFQLVLNVAACLLIFLAPIFGIDSPLSIVQMLWVNIIMDALGSLCFGNEPALKEYMNEKPKKCTDKLITRAMLISVLVPGLTLTALSLWFLQSDWVLSGFTSADARYTGFFTAFILFSVVNAFHVRTNSINIIKGLNQNPSFVKIMSLIVVVQLTMIYAGGDFIGTVPLTFTELGFALLIALLAYPLGVARKVFIKA